MPAIPKLKNKCRCIFHWNGTVEDAYEKCNTVCRRCPPKRREPIQMEHIPKTDFEDENRNIPEVYNLKHDKYHHMKHSKDIGCLVLFNLKQEYRGGKPWNDYFCSPTESREFITYWNTKHKIFKTSKNEKEAMTFTDDGDCDACMEHLKSIGAKTICCWYVKKNREVSAEAVHYPNEHWWKNDNLQPSLMNKEVADWNKEHGFE